jgi:hypothetical protein
MHLIHYKKGQPMAQGIRNACGIIAIACAMLATPSLVQARVYYHYPLHRHGWNGGNSGIPGNTKSEPFSRGNLNKSLNR